MTATTVEPEKILKDLAKLWADLAKQDSQKGSAGVLRACAMTLIAATEAEADAQCAGETIAELVHQHPSRVIVMRISPDVPDGLDARVFAQCWMPFGRRQQICCEEIEITASESRVDDLPNLVLGLMAPDLPIVLWCRSEKLARNASFQQLFPLMDKIIVDSSLFADPPGGVNFIRQSIAAGYNMADLSWTRLTRLRETVAQIFENEQARSHLKELQRIAITYTGPAAMEPQTMPACLQYLLAWFRNTLPVKVDAIHDGSEPQYDIRGISLEGPGFEASVEIQDSVAEVQVNRLSRRVSFPKHSDCDLLREELSIPGVDSIYRRCLG